MNPAQKKAVQITKEIISSIRIFPGQTEKAVAFIIDQRLKSFGATPAFPTIVGSGLNSLDPHARPTHKKIKKGEQIVVDLGARYGGYCADCTRTVFVGKPSKRQRAVYRLLKIAQAKAIRTIGPGRTCREIDLAARQYILRHCSLFCHLTDHRCLGDCFIHTTGHGVGRQVHQKPRLSLKNHYRLKVGEVITVEPGIYVKGWGGMRIEDMVEVTRTGCRVLTR